ncbi:hypothetical protein M422DRAFT_175557, partial [Sphaerobolus stellatus SS14]
VSGSYNQTIQIWNAHKGELVSGPFQGHTGLVNSVAFSPDGERVVSGSYDQTIQIWNAHTEELVFGPLQGQTDSRNTGWILGPKKELILWIPPPYRDRLWMPSYLTVIGLDVVKLDLSEFVHGPFWTECWKTDNVFTMYCSHEMLY